jgi:hypothetical protein
MLWTLLTAIGSASFVLSAVMTAKDAKTGIGGYVLAITAGVLLGAMNVWGWHRIGEYVDNCTKQFSPHTREWSFRGLLIALVLWALVAAFLGENTTKSLLIVISQK